MHDLISDAFFSILAAGFFVGVVVGLTGMGGGALMTPILVLLFGVEPLAAVSSDLVASLFMKPVGSAVHLKSGTVHRGLVKWLVLGSVPAAFVGVLLLKLFGGGAQVQGFVKAALGVALLVVSGALIASVKGMSKNKINLTHRSGFPFKLIHSFLARARRSGRRAPKARSFWR